MNWMTILGILFVVWLLTVLYRYKFMKKYYLEKARQIKAAKNK